MLSMDGKCFKKDMPLNCHQTMLPKWKHPAQMATWWAKACDMLSLRRNNVARSWRWNQLITQRSKSGIQQILLLVLNCTYSVFFVSEGLRFGPLSFQIASWRLWFSIGLVPASCPELHPAVPRTVYAGGNQWVFGCQAMWHKMWTMVVHIAELI